MARGHLAMRARSTLRLGPAAAIYSDEKGRKKGRVGGSVWRWRSSGTRLVRGRHGEAGQVGAMELPWAAMAELGVCALAESRESRE